MKKLNQRGAAVVEFAVVAPLLLLILFGIIEFGVLLYDKALLTNAGREGARAGIVFSSDRCSGTDLSNDRKDHIHGVVTEYCEDYLISFGSGSPPDIDIRIKDGANCEPGASLEVEVTYNFRFLVFSNLLGLVGGSMAEQLELTAITVMRLE